MATQLDPAAMIGRSSPLVSIITPTYRHQSFIVSCLNSVLAQTYSAWELIVIDDASPDQTADIVEQFADSDSRIRLIRHRSNYGASRLSETYNEALAQSSGELVAILEGDDEWLPLKLATQVPVFRDPGVVLSYADYDEVTPDGMLIAHHGAVDAIATGRSEPEQNLQFFSTLRSLGSNTVVVRREPLMQLGGFRNAGLPFVDYPTWLGLATRGEFVRAPAVLGKWRRHLGSVHYAQEYATLERLAQFFLEYLASQKEHLVAQGLTPSRLELLANNATNALEERQRSRSYFEGKRHLLMGQRLKSMSAFGRAMTAPRMSFRHRLGALAGMIAAATSPRVVLSLGRLAHELRPSRQK